MQGAVRLCEQRRVVRRGVAHRKVMKNYVVMVVFETAGRWQYEVGETRGFVAITIDRYHEVETAERGFELTAVRRRQYRVAGDRPQCAHLTVAGRPDLLGQCRRRQLATALRQAGPARFPRAGIAGRSEQRRGGNVWERRLTTAV